MKKIVYLLCISSILVTVGCEKSIDNYKGEDGIYIYGSSMNDSVGISFAYFEANVRNYEYNLIINTIGNPKEYDRKFIIEKIDEFDPENQAIEGIDYEKIKFGEFIMPAGQSVYNLKINFIRNPILLNGEIRKLSFRLLATDDFKLLYNRTFTGERYTPEGDTIKYNRYMDTQRSIKLTETIRRQVWWTSTGTGHTNLGIWSVKKSLLICDVLKLDRTAWLSSDQLGITSTAYLSYVGRAMHLWLQDNPTYEVDGVTLMKMGPASIY